MLTFKDNTVERTQSSMATECTCSSLGFWGAHFCFHFFKKFETEYIIWLNVGQIMGTSLAVSHSSIDKLSMCHHLRITFTGYSQTIHSTLTKHKPYCSPGSTKIVQVEKSFQILQQEQYTFYLEDPCIIFLSEKLHPSYKPAYLSVCCGILSILHRVKIK